MKAKQQRPRYQFSTFLRWFDWMGVQRHLRILGTFARLHHAYGKSGYLKDMPRILGYLKEACQLYPELAPLEPFVTQELPLCVP